MARQYQCGEKTKDRHGRPIQHGCGYKREAPWDLTCPRCGGWIRCVLVGKDDEEIGGTSIAILAQKTENKVYVSTGMPELDRILGGGVVKGCSILLAGEEGVGKTTLLLQILNNLAPKDGKKKALYASAEQNIDDMVDIARRIGAAENKNLHLFGNMSDVYQISEWVRDNKPIAVVGDSLQTFSMDDVKGDEGTNQQVQGIMNHLTFHGKKIGTVFFIVSQLNKAGAPAGPRAVTHGVDTVLHFEKYGFFDPDMFIPPDDETANQKKKRIADEKKLSAESKNLRILRTGKNRNGEDEQEGMFLMTSKGIVPWNKSRLIATP